MKMVEEVKNYYDYYVVDQKLLYDRLDVEVLHTNKS